MKSKDFVIQCCCHTFHFVTVNIWPEGKDPYFCVEGYLSVGGEFWETWKDRLKGAWFVLRGKNAHSVEVLLTPEKAEDLKRVIELYLAEARK